VRSLEPANSSHPLLLQLISWVEAPLLSQAASAWMALSVASTGRRSVGLASGLR